MTFRELRQTILEDVWLDTERYAEQVLFLPEGEPQRPVTAHVRFRQRDAGGSQGTQTEDEVIEVLVTRDPTHATKGGIDRPRSGDRLTRSPSRDPDRRPFVFTGEIVEAHEHKWRLVFRRRKTTIQGRGA